VAAELPGRVVPTFEKVTALGFGKSRSVKGINTFGIRNTKPD
jgi:hypothetical protein